jgi:hypothetical protein
LFRSLFSWIILADPQLVIRRRTHDPVSILVLLDRTRPVNYVADRRVAW